TPSCASNPAASFARRPMRTPVTPCRFRWLAVRCMQQLTRWQQMSNAKQDQTWAPVESLTFEEAQSELEEIVESLEDQSTSLDDALALWERGEALHAWCQQRLDHAAERLKKLTVSADEVAAVTAESGDEFAPEGAIPASAADDPAPESMF